MTAGRNIGEMLRDKQSSQEWSEELEIVEVFLFLIHQAPANRRSLFSHMVSVSGKQKHVTALKQHKLQHYKTKQAW